MGSNLINGLASYSNGQMYTNIQSASFGVGYAKLVVDAGESENPYFTVASKSQLSVDFNTSASGAWGVEIVGSPSFPQTMNGVASLVLYATIYDNNNGWIVAQGSKTIVSGSWGADFSWFGTFSGNYNLNISGNFVPGDTYWFECYVEAMTEVEVGGIDTVIAQMNANTYLNSVTFYNIPQGGGGGGGSCVAGTTPILLHNGKFIDASEIRVGDKVVTYNPQDNTYGTGKVQKVFITNQTEEMTINQYLQLAPDQFVLTERGWVQAINLTLNDSLFDALNSSYVQIFSISEMAGEYTIYDFSISNPDRDYIGWSNVMQDTVIC